MTAPQTKDNGQIVPRKGGAQEATLAGMVLKMQDEIKRALPRHITPERMGRIVLTALRTTKDLAKCTPGSFLGAVLSCAQLGLEPNTPLGHAWLIPYKQECTLIIGYQGFIELARRSGLVSSVYAHVVRDGDQFAYSLGLNPTLQHVPSADKDREAKEVTYAYAVARIKDADPVFVVLARAEIDARRKRSATKSGGPWSTDFAAMAKKTAVRELSKWIPRSPELARAVALDEAPEYSVQPVAYSEEVTQALESQGHAPELPEAEAGPPPALAGDEHPEPGSEG